MKWLGAIFLLFVHCRSLFFPLVFSESSDLLSLEERVQNAWESLSRIEKGKPKTRTDSNSEVLGDSYYVIYKAFLEFSNRVELEFILKEPAFLEGPHGEEVFVRNDSKNFGYYNPKFVTGLGHILDLPERNELFRNNTQNTYSIRFQTTARTFFIVHRKLNSNQDFFSREILRYKTLVDSGRLDPFYLERFTLFLHPDYTDREEDEGSINFQSKESDFSYPSNVAREAVGFWFRRKIDGTERIFFSHLKRLLILYDKDFLLQEEGNTPRG